MDIYHYLLEKVVIFKLACWHLSSFTYSIYIILFYIILFYLKVKYINLLPTWPCMHYLRNIHKEPEIVKSSFQNFLKSWRSFSSLFFFFDNHSCIIFPFYTMNNQSYASTAYCFYNTLFNNISLLVRPILTI